MANEHKHILPRLKVMADPDHAGKHPCHDSRFVATSDAAWYEEPTGFLETGSIIAQMKDCEHQAQLARLFAAAPEMLRLLRSATEWKRSWGADCKEFDAFLAQFSDVA